MGKTKAKATAPAGSATAGGTVALDELAQEQGVQPIADLDELGALWPVEDDPDAFLAFVESERAARRSTAQAKARKST